jgi:hypothetical protein
MKAARSAIMDWSGCGEVEQVAVRLDQADGQRVGLERDYGRAAGKRSGGAPDSVPSHGGCMKNKTVAVRFPPNLMEMLDNWVACPDDNVGWCLLCDGPIRSGPDPEQQHSQLPGGAEAEIPTTRVVDRLLISLGGAALAGWRWPSLSRVVEPGFRAGGDSRLSG